MKVQLEKLGIY